MSATTPAMPRHQLFDLTEQVALVTGGGRGLGLEMARGLAMSGARVYISGRQLAPLERACQSMQALGLRVFPVAFDVQDRDAAAGVVDRIATECGRLDILVNNVGIRQRLPMAELGTDSMRYMLDNHVIATFDLCKLVSKPMVAQKHGRIINMASISAYLASNHDAAYIAAKGAVVSLTRAMAAELGEHGITVNAIAPGPFATETNQEAALSEQGKNWVARRNSLGRWGRPQEIAGAAVFLASAAASFVSGHVLVVDGGLVSHY